MTLVTLCIKAPKCAFVTLFTGMVIASVSKRHKARRERENMAEEQQGISSSQIAKLRMGGNIKELPAHCTVWFVPGT